MLEAYATEYGIVVRDKDTYILVTEEGLKRTQPIRIDGKEYPDMSRVTFSVHNAALLAGEELKPIDDNKIYYNFKYEAGQQYGGKQLKDNPITGMIIKRTYGVLPYLYLGGAWTCEGENIVLSDDMYDVLYVPEDN